MLFYSVLILAAIAFAALAYFKPLWSLYLIAALLPTYLIRFQIGPIPFTWLELMIWLLFLAALIGRQVSWKKIREDYFFWPAVAILIAATIAVVVSPDKIHALGAWKAYFLEPVIYYFLAINLITSRRQIEGLFWALGLSVIYAGAFGLLQKFWPIGVPAGFLTVSGATDRITSFYGYPNAIGLYFGPIIVVFLGFLCYKNPDSLLLYLNNATRFWFKVAVVALGVLAVVLAKSEGALVAIVACAWLLFIFDKKIRWLTVALTAVFAVLAIFNVAGLKDLLLEKLLLQDWSGFVRRTMWQETWLMLKDNWLWGGGLSGYKLAIIPYHYNTWFETLPYPHNILLNFWSELGLLGVLAFGFLMIKFLFVNLKNIFSISGYFNELPFDKIASFVFLLVALEMLIHGLVDAPYFKNDLAMLFWILLAVTALNARLKAKNG